MKNLSHRVLRSMEMLGNFSPTSDVTEKMIKGYMADEYEFVTKKYFTSKQLRELSEDLIIIADFLDERAEIKEAE